MGKRRTYTPEFKAAVVLAVLSGAKTAAEICREHRIKESVLSRWKQKFVAEASQVFSEESDRKQSEEQIKELERMIGRLTMELEIAKKASLYLGSPEMSNGR